MNEATPQNEMPSRHEESRERRFHRRRGSAVGSLFLIGLAILLLLQQAGTISFDKWWSLLILIPAAAAFANSWKEFQAAGNRLNRRSSGGLIGGLILSLVTAVLFFNLDWGWFGPILLLVAGIGSLIRVNFNSENGS